MVFVLQNVTHGKIVVKLIGGYCKTTAATQSVCVGWNDIATWCEYV